MRNRTYLLVLIYVCLLPVTAPAQSLDALIDGEINSLVETYKMLHAAPELSHREEKTSAFFAGQLRALGYAVTERVGKFDRPEWVGYGVVAVLKNGDGPTVLLRTDLDALPVTEKTDLPYASKVKTKNDAGQEVGVMHACGHDIHITSMLGTARMLSVLKDQWRGTLIIVGQPAEETIDGARAMVKDGFFTRFPQPDFAIALHDSPDLAAGTVGVVPGYALASSTNLDLKIRGVGGHGSRPESAKDPIVLAAQIVLGLQTIVSRENSPLDPAVITVGSIHGGTRYNIIPDEVNLQLTVRAYKEEVRLKLLASIERVAKGVASAAGIPAELAPIVKVSETEVTTATYNDPVLTQRLAAVFAKALGQENVIKASPVMGSEDFGYFSMEQKIPTMMFWLGAMDPLKVKQSKEGGPALPSLHSPLFAPLPEPTLRTGVKAMTSAVLELLKEVSDGSRLDRSPRSVAKAYSLGR
ncbi:MAG: amidohydrolase [Acidobacteriota bacterium]|nr:amidohydrolase [Acidobacteriota bacterium]